MKQRNPEHQKELEQHAPYLAQQKAGEDFQVPEGYFDQLPDQLWQAVKANEASRAPSQTRLFSLKTWRAVAAAALVLLAVGVWLYDQTLEDTQSASMARAESNDLDWYRIEEEESGDLELVLFPETTADDPLDEIFAELEEEEEWDEWF